MQKSESVRNVRTEATGKGNGGNGLRISPEDVEKLLSTMKPRLQIVFQGLRYLVLAEKAAPGSTQLSEKAGLKNNLLLMFDASEEDAPAMKDLNTADNIHLQKEPCVDFRGVDNAAAAVVGEVGGKICFSMEKIQSAAIKNFDSAAEIFLLALASHEFAHHFISTGTQEGDEQAAREVQDFVEQQLVKNVEFEDKTLISSSETKYLEQFRDSCKEIFESIMPDGDPKQP